MTALEHLDPFTLLHSKPDDKVLSFRHRVLSAGRPPIGEEKSAAAVMQLVQNGTYEVVTDPNVKPSLRTCLECGCTDEFACDGGCEWVGVLLCSRCAGGDFMRPRHEIEAQIEEFSGDLTVLQQIKHAQIQTELLLDIREILMRGVIASEGPDERLEILERIAERAERRRIITAGADLLR